MGRLTGVETGDGEGGARAPDGGGVRTRGTRGQHSPLDGEGGPSQRGMPDSCEGGVSKGDPPAGVWSRRLGDRALVTVNPGWGPGLGADRSAVLSTRARGGPVGGPGVGRNTGLQAQGACRLRGRGTEGGMSVMAGQGEGLPARKCQAAAIQHG